MGDARYEAPLRRLTAASDREVALARMSFEELILALGAASRSGDPYLANVLASELLNRSRRGTATVASVALGGAAGIVLFFLVAAFLSGHPHNFSDHLFLLLAFGSLAFAALGAWLVRSPVLRRLMARRV